MLSARAGVVRACIARAQAYCLVIACMALAGNLAQAASSPIGATAGTRDCLRLLFETLWIAAYTDGP